MSGAAPEVLVLGAGAIGLYLGGRLAASGVQVHFVGRPRVVEALRHRGLSCVGLDGQIKRLEPTKLRLSTEVPPGIDPALCLLTVKGPHTEAAAGQLAAALPAGNVVLSMQNGVDNLARLQRGAPRLAALAGMVPFNVVQISECEVRQTTDGHLAAQQHPLTQAWKPRFEEAGLSLRLYEDMRAVQWAKLILNLNNPVNALSGLPLREQLLNRGFRQVLADLQGEALRVIDAAGLPLARVTPLPTAWIPRLLRLPTPLFRLLASAMLRIRPDARSSMYDDRQAGRPTEIHDLCGAVVRLAQHHGQSAPLNQSMLRLIEQTAQQSFLTAEQLQAALHESGSPG
ncbi:2-dehydropantoate 2-reductase [Pseudomarimonas arenosa]|uniref:2-dehydropantoate 2-reductase n=1 Tax=Pseudomarimonas arenosa TaxID=2774145 RepID=A0AAW3ZPA3_9GAMM|nr:2-dehydropantoate 2-reductase [Pseudomarimonas arenosa]MBD8526992.1 2-dehydropantoate 2-reductase [Pseudomarimonas arenosa]